MEVEITEPSLKHSPQVLYDRGVKLLIALYFFILATIQLGLLLGTARYFQIKTSTSPNFYWAGSLLASIIALGLFGLGIAINQSGTTNPEFNFTIANTLFYVAGVLQFLFCRSLNRVIGKRTQYAFAISVILFSLIFEFLRIHGNFEIRTSFVCIILGLFFILQILEISKKRKSEPSQQLLYLQIATSIEMLLAFSRLVILSALSFSVSQVEQVPEILIFVTIFQIVMNTLSYIAISTYWTEKITRESSSSELENQKINLLLSERENLICSLLKANKTSATGALSASIAHELNQPLGASNLNIQYLQKKLSEGTLSSEQNQEVLSALLADNQRAAGIIQSLRAIFSDGTISAEHVRIGDVIESVLKIAHPEIYARNIQVHLSLTSSALVNISRSELSQVVLNLINNAIQSLVDCANSPKKITIECQNAVGGIELVVADNGRGVNAAVQTHLFELLSESNKKGMGLGLWLCRHIVSRHGGHIRYHDNPGGGAQFIVFLPFTHS